MRKDEDFSVGDDSKNLTFAEIEHQLMLECTRQPVRNRDHFYVGSWSRMDFDYTLLERPDDDVFEIEPDWVVWKHRRTAPACDAIALALNVNPDVLWRCEPKPWDLVEKERPNAHRLGCALAQIVDDRYKEISDGEDGWHEEIDLLKFGVLIESLGEPFSLPEKFPRMVTRIKSDDSLNESNDCFDHEGRRDNPPYMTPKLRKLFDVMRTVKGNPGKKPIDIIIETMGYGRREAGIIAGLINDRPDGRSDWRDGQTSRQ